VIHFVVTSALSLARVTWWYGEDEIWPKALAFSPWDVAELAPRLAELLTRPELVADVWPDAPPYDAHLVVGTIEHVEGRPRAAARRHRRSGPMPAPMDLSEDVRWSDPSLAEVLHLLDQRTDVPPGRDPAMLRPRLHGRWAPA